MLFTTINHPTEAIKRISSLCKSYNWSAVVVGDKKTPNDWNCSNIHYLSLVEQEELFPKFARLVPYNHYSRKNIGYLFAISKGAKCILETDDDNIPYDTFARNISPFVSGRIIKNARWVNVYHYFTNSLAWPRGLPLDRIHEYGKCAGQVSGYSPIQQFLADGDPDVDAIHRLLFKHATFFDKDAEPVVLDKGVWCPFNSQNTVFYAEAFPLLYLPCHVSFRMTDIWRSFVAQMGLWVMDKKLSFFPATVKQDRNVHDLMQDFEGEVPGYLANNQIVEILENTLSPIIDNRNDSITLAKTCWESLVREKIISKRELGPMNEWFDSVSTVMP